MLEKLPINIRKILAWWILIVSVIAGLGWCTIVPYTYIWLTELTPLLKFWGCVVSGLMGVFSTWSGWYTFRDLTSR